LRFAGVHQHQAFIGKPVDVAFAASSTMRGHIPTEMLPRRFISDPVEDPFNSSTRENALGPPKASNTSSTVLAESSADMNSIYMIRVDRVNMTCVNTICDDGGMDTMGERLRYARKNAGFGSARAAALRFNWSPIDLCRARKRAERISCG
jgi:hypothetical protein